MPAATWEAPSASAPVRGLVSLPGSKSLTNRLLVLAALADGVSTLRRPLRARDTELMACALRQAGAEVDDGGRGTLPFTVRGRGSLPGGRVQLDSSASSQFVSGLLLAAARYDKGIEVVHTGRVALPSLPHVEMTVQVLRGAAVEAAASGPGEWHVSPGRVAPMDVTVEPDLSNAAPFLAAALVTGGTVTVPGWPARTAQAGDSLRDLLAAMGASVELTGAGLIVRGTGAITGLDADLHAVGELTPVLAAVAALADRASTFTGIAHLRGHETDRLAALAAQLNNLGARVTEQPDGLRIEPRPLHGGTWHAYADHRMATAGAVLGLVVPGVEVDDIGCTSKTLPDFPAMWAALLSN